MAIFIDNWQQIAVIKIYAYTASRYLEINLNSANILSIYDSIKRRCVTNGISLLSYFVVYHRVGEVMLKTFYVSK